MTHLIPRQNVPQLAVKTLGGGDWDISLDKPDQFTMVVFYRGYHCPVCKVYLPELEALQGEFAKRGTTVIAISSDTEERAALCRAEWRIPTLPIGWGLDVEVGRSWGLYVSRSRGKSSSGVQEPAIFTEPGLFLVRPDKTLYAASVVTMPFARPHFKEILQALDFFKQHNYPARGEA